MGRPIENDAFEMVNVLDLLKWNFMSTFFSNFEMILARYQLTCPHPLFHSELDLPLPLFQDGAKLTQAKAAVEAAQEDWFCWVKTAGWLGCTQLAGYFFQGPNWFNLWPFQIKIDHRQTKLDMLALWIFSLSFQGGPPNGSPVGPFHVENVNFPSIKWGDPFQDQKSWFFKWAVLLKMMRLRWSMFWIFWSEPSCQKKNQNLGWYLQDIN